MRNGGEPTPLVERARAAVRDHLQAAAEPERVAAQARAERALEILIPLGVDEVTQAATLLSAVFEGSSREIEAFQKAWGAGVTNLLVARHRMAGMGSRLRHEPAADTPAQVETLRRMLLALADDVRVVVMQLALHIARLEQSLDQPEIGPRLGEETLLVQAPLANRLGIWQLKWLMEDLAFRMTEPNAYRDIARRLDETRQEREAFVTTTITRLKEFLAQAGIEG